MTGSGPGAIASRAATRPLALDLDLDGVTHLSSAGVRVLNTVCRATDAAGTRVALHADAGTVVHQVLGLAGIPVVPSPTADPDERPA